MIVDFSNILSSTAGVQVQAHWEPIADATYNLHLILTPELAFIQNLPTNEFIKSFPIAKERKSQYLTWLKSSLAQVDKQ